MTRSIRRITRSLALTAAAAAALGVALAATASSAAAQASERHVLTGNQVAIWNLAGKAVISPSSGNEVVVEVRRGGADAERLSVDAGNGRLIVRYPDRDIIYEDRPGGRGETQLRVNEDGTFGNDNDDWSSERVRIRASGRGLEAYADLSIQVPRGQRIRVNIGVGTIEATNVNGELRFSTHASAITLRDVSGTVAANTGSGRISIDGASGPLTANTGSGGIDLADISSDDLSVNTGSGRINGRGVKADRFEVRTGSGGVEIEQLTTADLRASSGSGGLRLDLVETPRDAVLRSGSGRIALALPADASADLDITTGSGGISTEFAVTMEDVRRRSLRGSIGSGNGGRIRASTGSGGVRLTKR